MSRHMRRLNMRTSLVVASFGAALVALATGTSSSKAESAPQAYPYCAFRAGSTSCYHLTLESCGRSCIRNPAYVGDQRAHAILAGVGLASESAGAKPKANGDRKAPAATKTTSAIDPGARASAGGGNDFEGWPTGYLAYRFGDHQAQGRF